MCLFARYITIFLLAGAHVLLSGCYATREFTNAGKEINPRDGESGEFDPSEWKLSKVTLSDGGVISFEYPPVIRDSSLVLAYPHEILYKPFSMPHYRFKSFQKAERGSGIHAAVFMNGTTVEFPKAASFGADSILLAEAGSVLRSSPIPLKTVSSFGYQRFDQLSTIGAITGIPLAVAAVAGIIVLIVAMDEVRNMRLDF